jgi:hypothetical protein
MEASETDHVDPPVNDPVVSDPPERPPAPAEEDASTRKKLTATRMNVKQKQFTSHQAMRPSSFCRFSTAPVFMRPNLTQFMPLVEFIAALFTVHMRQPEAVEFIIWLKRAFVHNLDVFLNRENKSHDMTCQPEYRSSVDIPHVLALAVAAFGLKCDKNTSHVPLLADRRYVLDFFKDFRLTDGSGEGSYIQFLSQGNLWRKKLQGLFLPTSWVSRVIGQSLLHTGCLRIRSDGVTYRYPVAQNGQEVSRVTELLIGFLCFRRFEPKPGTVSTYEPQLTEHEMDAYTVLVSNFRSSRAWTRGDFANEVITPYSAKA